MKRCKERATSEVTTLRPTEEFVVRVLFSIFWNFRVIGRDSEHERIFFGEALHAGGIKRGKRLP